MGTERYDVIVIGEPLLEFSGSSSSSSVEREIERAPRPEVPRQFCLVFEPG